MNKKLNVVIVGVGHDHAHDAFLYITDKHSPYHLLGFCLTEKDNGNYLKYKKEYDAYKKYSINEALKLKDLDAVIIETDDTLLTKYATIFVKHKINVHMDKPGGQDIKSFDQILDLAKKNKTVVHLGYMYRYNPSIKNALKLYKSGALGKIYYIEAQMNITHPLEKRKWLKNFKGGMLNFLGCHLIDVVMQFLGKPDSVLSYNCSTSKEVGNDVCFTILKYKNLCSTVNTTAVEIQGFQRRHIVIVAEKAVIEIAPTELFIDGKLYSKSTYKTFGNNPKIKDKEINFGPTHRYKEMFDEFKKICNKEIKNPYSYEYEKELHLVLNKACISNKKEIKI